MLEKKIIICLFWTMKKKEKVYIIKLEKLKIFNPNLLDDVLNNNGP